MTNSDSAVRWRRFFRDRRRTVRPLVGWAVLLAAVGVLLVLQPAHGQDTATQEPPVGPDLYQRNCASCHGNQGQGTFRGPGLIGVGAASADYWLRSGRMPIAEPDDKAKRGEPAFNDAEIRELVAYVQHLGGGPGIPQLDLTDVNLAKGGELYRLNCASCHNWDGKGGALVNRGNAPPLHPVSNRQLAEAIRIGPGAMPQFSERQLDDQDLAAVVAYADYLRTPQDAGGYGLGHWGPSTETIAGFVALLVLVLVTAWLGERRRG